MKNAGGLAVAAALSPFEILINNLSGYAQANTNFTEPNEFYANIFNFGAPPRWMFDLILKVGANDQLMRNNYVITEYNRNINLSHTMEEYNSFDNRTGDYVCYLEEQSGLFLPPIWTSNVKTSTGDQPALDIARNWISIRGIESIPFHNPAFMNLFEYSGSQFSSNSFVTASGAIGVAPLSLNDNFSLFKSRNNTQLLNLGYVSEYDNPINTLLKFLLTRENHAELTEYMKKKSLQMQEALLEFSPKTKKLVSYNNLLSNFRNANKLFENQVEAIVELFPQAYQKYVNIIHSVYQNQLIDGVDNINLVFPQGHDSIMRLNANGADLSGINLHQYYTNIQNLDVVKICSSFAMLEISIMENLSNSLSLGIGEIQSSRGILSNDNDLHDFGSVLTLYSSSKYYLSLLSCLSELKNTIGSKFQKTLIQYQGEFNRTPRNNEVGSDHDSSNVISFFTGKVTSGPFAGGPAKLGINDANYQGDFGAITGLNENQKVHVMDIYDSLAGIYNTQTGGRFPEPVFGINNGQVWFSKMLRNFED